MRLRATTVYSERIERAIKEATYLHRNQVRLTGELPYVSHLFSVFLLVSKYTNDEDTLIAALLHDAVEDTDCAFEELERGFGARVTSIVRGVTEEKERNGKKLPWKERKLGYLENLRNDSEESMLVCVADKIHNLNSLITDYEEYGDAVTSKFTASIEDKLWYHGEVVAILYERIRNREALNDLKRVYARAQLVLLGEKSPRNKAPFASSTELPKVFMGEVGRAISPLAKPLKTLRFRGLSARIFGYGNRNTL